jgi:metal-responsive CopG/Arc/MetJ family transcriptional regulator
MGAAKVAISIDEKVLSEIDQLVKKRVFPNRSAAIQMAVEEKLSRLQHTRLARECSLLTAAEEQAFAENDSGDLKDWPKY